MKVSFQLVLVAVVALVGVNTCCDALNVANAVKEHQPAATPVGDKASEAPACSESVGDALITDLVDWIKDNGGTVDNRQEVRKANNITSPHHVYATSFIPKGTLLLTVPWELVIEPTDDMEQNPLCDAVQILSQEMEANKKGNSKYGPYLRYLESTADSLPSTWSQGGKDLLKKVLGKNLLTDVNAIDKEFWTYKRQCVKGQKSFDPREQAARILLARQSPNPPSHEDDIEWYQLIPFYDFYSPREGGDYNVDFGQDGDEEEMYVIAKRDIQEGEEIHTPLDFGSVTMDPNDRDYEGKLFVHSGKIERRYSFSFTDPTASKLNKDLPVKFDLDVSVDNHGKRTFNVSWIEGVRPNSRAYQYIRDEIKRMKEVVTILPLDALNYLHPAAEHERKAIEEYAWALIDALTALLETKHDPREITPWTVSDHTVAGVNLASYNLEGITEQTEPGNGEAPFELFDDFDMSDMIIGNENWKDMIEYRRKLQRPTVSFYVDKVARKRWLPQQGFPQAKQFVLQYGSELTETGNKGEEAKALYELIPDEVDYAAKPSHHSEGVSVWLVSHDKEKNTTMFSSTARQLMEDEKNEFNKMQVANSLTKHLHAPASNEESWILRNVRPGVVLEERFVEVDKFDRAPVEFNCFVIWGRLWVAQLNHIEEEDRFAMSWIHRDGSYIHGKEEFPPALEYIDFSRIVEMAESLARNKDMFRVDIFVGIPASSPSLRANATREERMAAVQYAINECEIYPTTSFRWWPQLAQDGARLWVAGYKIGNYRTIQNDEVPKEFVENGYLPTSTEKP